MQVGTLIYWNGAFTKGDPKNKWIGIVKEKHENQDYWRVVFPTTEQWIQQREMEVICK